MSPSLIPLTDAFSSLPFLEMISPSWPSSLFAVSLFSKELIAIVAIIGGLLVAVAVVLGAMYFHHEKQKLWHETARLALEKGQPVPPMPLRDEEIGTRPPPGVSYAEWHQAQMAEGRVHDFKGGLVLVAVGAGLYLMLPYGSRMVAAIPGFIGVALLVNTLIQKLSSRRDSPSDNRPPHA